MQHRTVGDLMTRDVVRVHRDAPFKTIIRLMAESEVTALPVVDDLDHPVGVVSEADLLRTVAAHPDPAGLPLSPRLLEGDQPGAEGVTAGELMSAPPVCARPGWTVVEAARLMDAERVKRLPVVDETDTLVGIVSRADLLRIFLRRDEAMRDEIIVDVLTRTLHLAPTDVVVTVQDGRVTLKGNVDAPSLVPVIERLCRGVDGVVSVSADLSLRAEGAQTPGGVA
ncbi:MULTISPECIES: CBS domain-containing protein [unclassified Streptomyces]|uniref:CBS domain-containing protein n=1 Tax=unclassified Streptomyces TaxID=2593676 RepID=UPI001F04C1D9|nr:MULTISPECIES: CBS domain-containing protein [unclassified Streptomyces]MCH0565736.1 CBS domain-containing protein [Streptomyces sp. MUM 2J]MCH0570583.1 CBS domain-containing protein [Streptomyces sp. MUM 136J]